MKRSKHSLSHYRLLTADMGELLPVACYEVLPGDSIQQSTSLLLRVSPLLAPVMHPVQVRIHHWFVPHRIVWDRWEDFITGGKDGLGDGAVFPTIGPFSPVAGGLYDYLGLAPGVNQTISALPTRSYNRIWSEFYRDADLVADVSVDDGNLKKVAWEKDYFAAARPWPQKGPDVSIPLGDRAPVKGIGAENQAFSLTNQNVYQSGDSAVSQFPIAEWINVTTPERYAVKGTAASGGFPDIYADLTNATAANVNTVRRAFALQRYQEARAQYGHRYSEYLAFLGVRSSDARLQRPEYLGGGKATISFSEVLQTGPEAAGGGVANLKGHGISALRSRRFRRFFEEHGLVLSLLSVRPRAMYMQGTHRMWSRRLKEDYWQRELELIGQQEIRNKEIYQAHATPEGIFGYGDRYSEYRHLQSGVSGDFRTSLNFWHMAREFGAAPVLNSSFVECVPTKRINAVSTNDVLWIMCNHSIQARRMVTKKTIGRII